MLHTERLCSENKLKQAEGMQFYM